MTELEDYFITFIEYYYNYDLYLPDLIHSVISMFCYTKHLEYNKATNEYDKVIELMIKYELYGTADLCESIHYIYDKYIEPNK